MTSIPVFSGNNTDYFPWWKIVTDCAKLSGPYTSPYGLLPLLVLHNADPIIQLMPDIDFHAGPFQPPANPGPQPVLPPAATVAEVGRFNAEHSAWKFQHETFTASQKEINTFTSALLAALPTTTLTLIGNPRHGTLTLTLTTASIAIYNHHGRLTANDLTNNEAKLSVPYKSSDTMFSYIATHQNVHLIADMNNQPINENTRVTRLLDGLKPCGLFNVQITAYESVHARADQRDFDDLRDTVLNWYAALSTSTTGSLGYSAAVTTPSVPTLTPADHTAIAAAIVAQTPVPSPRFLPRTQGRGGRGGRGLLGYPAPAHHQRPPATPGVPAHYCWTHGSTFHSGVHCRNPASGHQIRATFANKMGGAP